MDKRLRTVGRCIASMHERWDTRGINDNMLSDIEVDLESALAALNSFLAQKRDERNAAYSKRRV